MEEKLWYILESFCRLYANCGMYEKCHPIAVGRKSLVQRNGLYSTDSTVLLASEKCKTKVSIGRLTIQDARAEHGLHASQNFAEKGLA